jgi:midasin
LGTSVLSQTFDLIDFVATGGPHLKSKTVMDQINLKTFYRAYSIGSSILNKFNIHLDNQEQEINVLAHVLFGSSIKISNQLNVDLSSNTESSVFNIYFDSSIDQVLKCKLMLDKLRLRLNQLLVEWESNPILIEITKIVHRIESFNLNEPLMKYLTGVEILLEKCESWQLIAAKQYSLEVELKSLNELVVEWRKLELKHWLFSLDNELNQFKKTKGKVAPLS